jgi:hypothetical protein
VCVCSVLCCVVLCCVVLCCVMLCCVVLCCVVCCLYVLREFLGLTCSSLLLLPIDILLKHLSLKCWSYTSNWKNTWQAP